MWKYGEVHRFVRGSSRKYTGRFARCVPGSSLRLRALQRSNLKSVQGSSPWDRQISSSGRAGLCLNYLSCKRERTGKFTELRIKLGVRGSSHPRPCSGLAVQGSSLRNQKGTGQSLAEAPHTTLRRVVEQEGLSCPIHPDASNGRLHAHTRP